MTSTAGLRATPVSYPSLPKQSSGSAQGPVGRNVNGVSNTNSQLVGQHARQEFISHQKLVTELLTQVVSLAKGVINNSATDPASVDHLQTSVGNPVGATQSTCSADRASLEQKIMRAVESLPSGTTFAVNKALTAKRELFDEFKNSKTFNSLPKSTLAKFSSVLEGNDGNNDRNSRAMQLVNDFLVMRHELKSRFPAEDTRAHDELNALTKSFISTIAHNGVGIDSVAAGSSKNTFKLKEFRRICDNLVKLDKHSVVASGLSFNVEISKHIHDSLVAAGLTGQELEKVMADMSIFRQSIEQQNDILNTINYKWSMSPFEQAQTRLGQESVTLDLLINRLAESAQPDADDAVKAGPGPEVEAAPSSKPGINITINAPFSYTYYEGNVTGGNADVNLKSQPAPAMTSRATQTEGMGMPEFTSAVINELPEAIHSSTQTLQTPTNDLPAKARKSPEQRAVDNTQTSTSGEPLLQPLHHKTGGTADAATEPSGDDIYAVRVPAAQPESRGEQRTDTIDRAIGTNHNPGPSVSPASSYIGGPGSSGARNNPADARRTSQIGTRALNSQGTQWQGLTGMQAGSAAGTPVPSASPSSSYIGGPGSSGARNNPADARRTSQIGTRALNSQGTQWQGLTGMQAGSAAGTPVPSASPSSSYIGGPGSSGARKNPAEARPKSLLGTRALNSQGTQWLSNPPGKGAQAGISRSLQDVGVKTEPAGARSVMPDGTGAHNSQSHGRQWQGLTDEQADNSAVKGVATGRFSSSQGVGVNAEPAGTQHVMQGGTEALSQVSEKRLAGSAAGKSWPPVTPSSPYIGAPGSSSARINPAQAQRTAQATPYSSGVQNQRKKSS